MIIKGSDGILVPVPHSALCRSPLFLTLRKAFDDMDETQISPMPSVYPSYIIQVVFKLCHLISQTNLEDKDAMMYPDDVDDIARSLLWLAYGSKRVTAVIGSMTNDTKLILMAVADYYHLISVQQILFAHICVYDYNMFGDVAA